MTKDDDPHYVLAAAVAFLPLCAIVVGLRFTTRRLQNAKFKADDWLTLPALALMCGCAIILIIGVKHKVIGYHSPPSSDTNRSVAFNKLLSRLTYSFFPLQILGMGFTKLSFVTFYRRIFATGSGASPLFDISSRIVIVILSMWMTAFFFDFVFICGSHFSARWMDEEELSKFCPANHPSELGLAVSDFVTDAMVLLLPIPMVLRLHLRLKQKIGVLFIFSLGFIAMAASIVRLGIFVWIFGLSSALANDPNTDSGFITTRGLYWSMLESGLALIACCLPALSGLIRSPALEPFLRSIPSFGSLSSNRSRSGARRTAAQRDNEGRAGTAAADDTKLGERPEGRKLGVLPSTKSTLESYELEDTVGSSDRTSDASKRQSNSASGARTAAGEDSQH